MYKNKLKLLSLIFLIPLMISLQGCSKDSSNPTNSTPQNENEIFIQSMSFSPSSKTVAVGTTITWTNKDNFSHNVTSGTPGAPDGKFSSGNMGGGATYSFTFATAGTYKYFCSIHPSMTGTIIVQ